MLPANTLNYKFVYAYVYAWRSSKTGTNEDRIMFFSESKNNAKAQQKLTYFPKPQKYKMTQVIITIPSHESLHKS